MNKRLMILILILLILVSTSIFLTKEDPQIEIDTAVKSEEIKGESTEECLLLEDNIKDALANTSPLREWYVKSPYIENNIINIKLSLPKESISVVEYTLNDGNKVDAIFQEDKWVINIPVEELKSGKYKLLVVCTSCENEISKSFSFKVSNPVYVVWSIDWEGFDVKEEYLNQMADISTKYNIPMTHFFNPYIYIYLAKNRYEYLTNWVVGREEDSIGLHLHMYNSLVEASGVNVHNNPAWGSPTGNGHDTPNSNYEYNEFRKIISWALTQFEKFGLPRPTMYRAGGWYIDEENINVLNNLGFNIESSGRTSYIHGRNSLEGHWDLQETTQPYQMNSEDQNVTDNPNINIWEYPNNGGDSWAYSSDELISRFDSNYKGGITKEDIIITYLSHPHWFNTEGPHIEGALKYAHNYRYDNDNGPVIFITLDKVHTYNVKL